MCRGAFGRFSRLDCHSMKFRVRVLCNPGGASWTLRMSVPIVKVPCRPNTPFHTQGGEEIDLTVGFMDILHQGHPGPYPLLAPRDRETPLRHRISSHEPHGEFFTGCPRKFATESTKMRSKRWQANCSFCGNETAVCSSSASEGARPTAATPLTIFGNCAESRPTPQPITWPN